MSDWWTKDWWNDSATTANGSGAQEGKVPENFIIVRRGIPVDVQNEDRFSPMNTFAFSPIAQNYFSIDNVVLAAAVLKMAKDRPQLLAKLMDNYMNNVTKILAAVLNSAKTHPIAMLNAHTTFACVAQRFGILNDSHYLKIVDQTRSIVDKLIQLDFLNGALGGLETLVEGAQGIGTGAATLAASLKSVKP